MMPLIVPVILMLIILGIWSFLAALSNKQFKPSKSVHELVDHLVYEIHNAIESNKLCIFHKINVGEPPIDGEVATLVTFKVATITPCIITFSHEAESVKIDLHVIGKNHVQ